MARRSLDCSAHPYCRDIEAATAPQRKAGHGETGCRARCPDTVGLVRNASVSQGLCSAGSKVATLLPATPVAIPNRRKVTTICYWEPVRALSRDPQLRTMLRDTKREPIDD